jgi:hypothetical protein
MIEEFEKLPMVGKWAVRYDRNSFPEYVQGIYFGSGGTGESGFGKKIQINDIEVLDMVDNFVITKNKMKYKLLGEGHRVILLSNKDFDMINSEDEYDEDPEN